MSVGSSCVFTTALALVAPHRLGVLDSTALEAALELALLLCGTPATGAGARLLAEVELRVAALAVDCHCYTPTARAISASRMWMGLAEVANDATLEQNILNIPRELFRLLLGASTGRAEVECLAAVAASEGDLHVTSFPLLG